MNNDNNKKNNINYDKMEKTNEMSIRNNNTIEKDIILVDDINNVKQKMKKRQFKNIIIEESKNFISSNTKKIIVF